MRLKTAAFLFLSVVLLAESGLKAQNPKNEVFPVRGFCISAPSPARVDEFIRFIDAGLAPRGVNTLILMVDYNYQYTSHPELAQSSGLSKADVGKLAAACRKQKIRIIPQINLLGHQSWARTCGKLLKEYPDFDETPWVKFPEKYSWPNPDGLYCKSYCPLHPKVHDVVFAVVDELCEAFDADAFHAGMDEVFYLGDSKCPRCAGKDKAELFADEVRRIRDHLHEKGREMWMWGDRLLDGKTTGLGEWEASMNGTDRAIDLIPRDVVICDWHYDRPDQTAIYFAMKGLKVVTCPWNNPASAVSQVQDMAKFRQHSTPQMKGRLLGVTQTIWNGLDNFLDRFNEKKAEPEQKSGKSEIQCFTKMFEEVARLNDSGAATGPAAK